MTKGRARPRQDETAAIDLAGRRSGYLRLATRPLHILVFLLPLIALFEYGAWMYLGRDAQERETILAQRMLQDLFASLGVTGVHLPAILAVVVLLVWHVLTRDRWRVRPLVVLGMWGEAALWTAPLLVLGVILSRALGLELAAAAQSAVVPVSLGESLTIAIGAGLYEELLFRLLGITVALLILEDLACLPKRWALPIAIVLTSVAFAWYHDPTTASGVDWRSLAYYAIAGAYFGVLFAARGFGIAVGVHALYDAVVLASR